MSYRTPLPLAGQGEGPRALNRPVGGAPLRGLVLHEGPSPFTGAPVVVVATGLNGGSENPKTGAMVQVWTLSADTSPVVLRTSRQDETVCGECPLRGPGGGCYVLTFRAPLQVWNAYRGGSYPRWDGRDLAPFRRRLIRWGAYGEPVALPYDTLRRLSAVSGGWTGYTHAWRDPRFVAYRSHLMASVESPAAADDAHAMGWRTFRIRPVGGAPLPGEIVCPASAEGGERLTCEVCGVCDGHRGRTALPSPDRSRRASVVVLAHGGIGTQGALRRAVS